MRDNGKRLSKWRVYKRNGQWLVARRVSPYDPAIYVTVTFCDSVARAMGHIKRYERRYK